MFNSVPAYEDFKFEYQSPHFFSALVLLKREFVYKINDLCTALVRDAENSPVRGDGVVVTASSVLANI